MDNEPTAESLLEAAKAAAEGAEYVGKEPEIEVVNEPAPGARASGKSSMGMTMRLINAKTGEQVSSHTTHFRENERRPTDYRKY